jgi:hypothetical protein
MSALTAFRKVTIETCSSISAACGWPLISSDRFAHVAPTLTQSAAVLES